MNAFMRTHARPAAAALAIAAAAASIGLAQQPGPGGQQPPATTAMVLKGKAPVSNEILRVKLPRPAQATLANGLRLMVLEDRRLPQVTFQIIVPGAGGYFDPSNQLGLATYTATMMREGTKTRTSPQISEALETIAANVNVGTGSSGPNASIFGSALTEDLGTLMDLTADILLNPSFPADEWDRLRTRTKAGLQQQRSQPGFLAAEMFNRVVFGNHPASRITTTPAMLDAMTPTTMTEFHRARYVPDHAAIAFAGDISLAEARKLVDTKLGGWKKSGATKPAVEEPPASGSPKVYLIARPASVQTTLAVGTQSMTRTDPDYTALTVANRVLGGPMGRLFRHLREEKGYTYGVGSFFSAPEHRGAWQASTSVRTEVTEPALNDLLAEIAELREKPIPDKELADSKRAVVANFALSLENPLQVLGYYLDSWVYGLPADYWDTYPARIEAVTAAQAQAAAKKYLDAGRLQIVAVGDATKITDILKKKGDLEAFDSEGRPLR
jgi:predicted Zn-dependent peptidase